MIEADRASKTIEHCELEDDRGHSLVLDDGVKAEEG